MTCKTCEGSGAICIGGPEYGLMMCPVCNGGPSWGYRCNHTYSYDGCKGTMRPAIGGLRCDTCSRILPPASGDFYRTTRPGVPPVYAI